MKGSALILSGFLVLQLWSSTAEAQEDHPYFDSSGKYSGTYLCVAAASGGVRYDENVEEWRGVSFKADNKVILSLTFEGHGIVESFAGRVRVAYYSSNAGNVGSELDICNGENYDVLRRVMIFKNGSFQCRRTPFMFYNFDLGSLRFMEVYTYGYIGGADDNDDTPFIAIGECSKIGH